MISWSSSTASSTPATSLNVTFGESTDSRFGPRLAEAHHARAATLDGVHQEYPERQQQDERQYVGEQREPVRPALALHRDQDVVLAQVPISGPRSCPGSRSRTWSCRRSAVTLSVLSRVLIVTLLTWPLSTCVEELAEVRLRLLVVLAEEALREEREHDDDQDREGRVLEKSAHLFGAGKVPAPGVAAQRKAKPASLEKA